MYTIQKSVITPVRILVGRVISYRPDAALPEPSLQSEPMLCSGDEFEILEHAIINMNSRIENTMFEHKLMSSRIEAIINSLSGMVYQCLNNPPYYTCTFVSVGCTDLIGYTPEQLIGKPDVNYTDIVKKKKKKSFEKKCAETLAVGLPLDATYRIILKNGKEK
jgi:hypothetical protein